MVKLIKLLVFTAFVILITGCTLFKSNEPSTVIDVDQRHPNDHRHYRHLELANKLQVLLISDTTLKKSAAALDVQVGSLADPKEHQGLAHFLEHMLFLGTKKYPVVGDYKKFLTAHSGHSNAYTSGENTNYHFEVNHKGFEGALDRFAQFFTEPLFNPEFVEREMNAVNSEHQKNLQNDYWRIRMVERLLHKEGHPRQKFSTGDLETLKNVTRDILLQFYRRYYSSNNMRLVTLSNVSLDDQEAWVRKRFATIPNKNTARPSYSGDIYDDAQLPQLIKIVPVTEQRVLKLSFETPSGEAYWRSKPDRLLGFLIGHEGKGSLLSLLKSQDLVTSLSAGLSSTGYAGSFNVTMNLTENGYANIDAVIENFFSYVKVLKDSGFQDYVFEEERTMSAIQYVYREQREGTGLVSSYAALMQQHPALELEKRERLFYEPSADDYNLFLSFLKPEKLRAVLIAPDVKTDVVEKFYKTHYNVSQFTPKQVSAWQHVKVAKSLAIPEVNPFIPRRLDLITNDPANVPTKLIDDERGVFWFQQDKRFKLPRARVAFTLLSDVVQKNPRNRLLSVIYNRVLSETLNEWQYPLTLSGLSFAVGAGNTGIGIQFSGFSERIPHLMTVTAEKLRHLSLSAEVFSALKEKLKREFANVDYKAAYQQTFYERDVIMNSLQVHRDQYVAQLAEITLDEVNAFADELYRNIAIEGVAYGNLSRDALKKGIDTLFKQLHSAVLPVDKRPENDTIKLAQTTPLLFEFSSKTNNNCWLEVFQFGKRHPTLNAIIRVGAAHLESGFYSEMRTRQQLGYIVWSGRDYRKNVLGMMFLIQSASHLPLDLEARAHRWLQTAVDDIEKMTSQQFNQYRDAAITKLGQPDKTISEVIGTMNFELIMMKGAFDYKKRVIAALEKLTKNEVIAEFKRVFLESKGQRLAVHLYADGKERPSSGTKKKASDNPARTRIQDVGTFKKSAEFFR